MVICQIRGIAAMDVTNEQTQIEADFERTVRRDFASPVAVTACGFHHHGLSGELVHPQDG